MFFSSASSSSSRAKMVNKRRDYTEEFNTNIRFIQTEIASLVDSNNNELNIITVNKQISECLARLDQLLTNDYFYFMFVNNLVNLFLKINLIKYSFLNNKHLDC
jgi:hypothetical protein